MAKKQRNLEYNNSYTFVPKLTQTFQTDKEPASWATEKFAKSFAQMYLNYYTSPDRIQQRNGLTLYEFVSLYRMPYRIFKNLRIKFPIVEEAVEYATGIIAMRRENGYETGELTGKTMHMMRYYQDLWKEEQQRLEDFKLQLADKTKPDQKPIINVYKECFNEKHDECKHDKKD